MVVKYQIAPHDDNVIPGVPGDWANPAGFESALRVNLEKCVCEDVARARCKEHPVGQPPLFNGIGLRTRCTTHIHSRTNITPQ